MASPQKTAALNLIPEEEDKERQMNAFRANSKSCESLYSVSSKGSASLIYKSKAHASLNNKSGIAAGARQPAIIPATNEVRQRVLSARRLRMKTYQNQLADAQQTIAELSHENRILRTLHKRQDSALSKYESTNAELPQLLHSHAEELRVWQTKYRNLQAANKELDQKIKQKETLILQLSDQNKHFIQLNKDKNLEDRHRLTEKLQTLEACLQEKENEMKMMARKMQLEKKQAKQQLQIEQKKTREILMKLENARLELSGYRKLEEMQLQEKFNLQLRRKKVANSGETIKEEKESDKCLLGSHSEAKSTDESEVSNSQRSTFSDMLVQRTSRSINNALTKNQLTLSSSTIVIQQSGKQLASSNKQTLPPPPPPAPAASTVALRRMEQSVEDASKTHNVNKTNHSISASLMPKQHSNLPFKKQTELENFENEYEDADYENDDDEDVDVDVDVDADADADADVDELEEAKEYDDNVDDNDYGNNDLSGNYVKNIDGPDEDIDNIKYNDDYYKERETFENHNPGKKTRMKEEISTIRKQISDDYKERESFLDTFCRQATNGSIVMDDNPKKHITIPTEHNITSSRKNKLLAALKAIDDNKNQD